MPGEPPAGAPPGRRFFVEFATDEACPFDFLDDPVIVLFFASWAFSLRFGAMHDLAQAAQRMQRKHHVELKPLLRYADRDIDDDGDRRELERVWQDPAPLAECCRAVAGAAESAATEDAELAGFLAGYDHLAPRLRELAAMCDWAAGRPAGGAQVRLTFLLD